MSQSEVPDGPFVKTVPGGRTYFLCQCGRSQRLPNCDASHRKLGGSQGPLPITPDEDEKVIFCGCRLSKRMPFCDDAHKERNKKRREEAEASQDSQ